jgi:uncharacterized protein (TIGR03435 family)
MGATRDQRNLMLQSLLTERFNVKVHFEKKTHAAYDLVLDKRGFKLRPSARAPVIPEMNKPMLAMTGQKSFFSLYPVQGGLGIFGPAMTIDDFRGMLEGQLDGVPVLDKTGVTGSYDFQIEFARENVTGDSSLPSLFTAVEECCGLRMQQTKAEFDVVVIDRIQRPTEN